MIVEKNTVVSFRFRMFDEHGNVLQDTFSSHVPSCMLYGGASENEQLAEKLNGLTIGEHSGIRFSDKTRNYTFTLLVQDIRRATDAELLLGYPMQIDSCNEHCECHNPRI